ncbi:CA216 protein, partial [Anseranas semipalmata]|nr:CA216 protein [Anseranas semipalmata]
MFAVCPPDAPANGLFPGGPALGTAFPGAGSHSPDSNCNFAGEACDSNQNWSRPAPGSGAEGGCSRGENMPNPSDNLLLLMQRQMVQGRLTDAALSAACPPEEGERSPPEGAEVGGVAGGEPPSSPAEDNGYASSSLSIDSPDSTCGSAWDPPGDPPEVGAAEPHPGPLFPALAEAVQHLQDKERFKEREKEKHHVQLVMYRRLALLRWIHGLQQKVVEQQNRLQESFDTILDNRKELIRFMQQGAPCPAGAAAPSP